MRWHAVAADYNRAGSFGLTQSLGTWNHRSYNCIRGGGCISRGNDASRMMPDEVVGLLDWMGGADSARILLGRAMQCTVWRVRETILTADVHTDLILYRLFLWQPTGKDFEP